MRVCKDWVFLTKDNFDKIRKKFELKNLKKINHKNLGLHWWMKEPDLIKYWEEVDWEISIPAWLRGFFSFENNYWEIKKIDIPELNNLYKGNEMDIKQDKIVEELLEQPISFWHISTWVWKNYDNS